MPSHNAFIPFSNNTLCICHVIIKAIYKLEIVHSYWDSITRPLSCNLKLGNKEGGNWFFQLPPLYQLA